MSTLGKAQFENQRNLYGEHGFGDAVSKKILVLLPRSANHSNSQTTWHAAQYVIYPLVGGIVLCGVQIHPLDVDEETHKCGAGIYHVSMTQWHDVWDIHPVHWLDSCSLSYHTHSLALS